MCAGLGSPKGLRSANHSRRPTADDIPWQRDAAASASSHSLAQMSLPARVTGKGKSADMP